MLLLCYFILFYLLLCLMIGSRFGYKKTLHPDECSVGYLRSVLLRMTMEVSPIMRACRAYALLTPCRGGFRRNSARRDADECYEFYRLTSSPELLRRKSRPITFIRSRMNCRGDVILRCCHGQFCIDSFCIARI